MAEKYRIRRSFSGNIEVSTLQQHLKTLSTQPSEDIVLRSNSTKNQPRSLSVLKTRPPSPARSKKSRSNLRSKPDLVRPTVALPTIQKKEGRLRLNLHQRKFKTQADVQAKGKQPASSLLELIRQLRLDKKNHFYYVSLDSFMNFEIVKASDQLLEGNLPQNGLGTISAKGLMYCTPSDNLFFTEAEVEKCVSRLRKLASNHYFKTFLIERLFRKWKSYTKRKLLIMGISGIDNKLDLLDPELRNSLRICYQRLHERIPLNIFGSDQGKVVPLQEFSKALEAAIHKHKNILDQTELGWLLRATLEPLQSRLEKMSVEARLDRTLPVGVQSAFTKNLAFGHIHRFIRKILFIVSEARLDYLNTCYTELLNKIEASFNSYQQNKPALLRQINAVLSNKSANFEPQNCFNVESNTYAVYLNLPLIVNGSEISLEIAEEQILSSLLGFLESQTGKMHCPRELVRGLNPATKEMVRSALSSLVSSEKCGLASFQDEFASVKLEFKQLIRQLLQEIQTVLGIYQTFVSEMLAYLNSPKTDIYSSQLRSLTSFKKRCDEGLLNIKIGFLLMDITNIRNQLKDFVSSEQRSISMRVREEFLQAYTRVRTNVARFGQFKPDELTSITEFTGSCLKLEDYEENKSEEVTRPRDNLRNILAIMQEIQHEDAARFRQLSLVLEGELLELDIQAVAFRNQLEVQAKKFMPAVQQQSNLVNTRLKVTQKTCLNNLEQAFPTLLTSLSLQIEQLEEVDKIIHSIAVVERVTGVSQPTDFPLAKILKYELVHVVSLLSDFTQYRQTLLTIQKRPYRDITLNELLLYFDETISKIKSKFKVLHQFEKLLQRLLRYFQLQKTSMQTLINLQQLDYSDMGLLDPESCVDKKTRKQIEDLLIKPKTLGQLLESNVHEYCETITNMVRSKQSVGRLKSILESLQRDEQNIQFGIVKEGSIEIVENLSEVLERLQEYDTQLTSLKDRMNESLIENYKMIQYSLSVVQDLEAEQTEVRRMSSLILTCKLSGDTFRHYLEGWQEAVCWLKKGRLGVISHDYRNKHLASLLQKIKAQLKAATQRVQLLSEEQCAKFPKLYFFSPAEVVALLANNSDFFPKYYLAVDAAEEKDDELRLTTRYNQTIRLLIGEDDEGHPAMYAYDKALKIYIHSSIISWLRNKHEERLMAMVGEKELGQVVVSVDYVQLCAAVDKLVQTHRDSKAFRQEEERLNAEINQLLKLIRLENKDVKTSKYEQTVMSSLILARIGTRQRLHLAQREPQLLRLTVSLDEQEGNVCLKAGDDVLRLQYEPVDFASVIIPYKGSEKNQHHLIRNVCRHASTLVSSAGMLEEVATASMRQLNKFPITAQNLIRKLTAAANTDTWSCFSLLEFQLPLLQEVADLLTSVKKQMQLQEKCGFICHKGSNFKISNLPVLAFEWPHSYHQDIPADIRNCFRSIDWMPPSVLKVAHLMLSARGIDQPDTARATDKIFGLIDVHIFLKFSSPELNDNAVSLTRKVIKEFIGCRSRGKNAEMELLEAAKRVFSYAGSYENQLNLIENALFPSTNDARALNETTVFSFKSTTCASRSQQLNRLVRDCQTVFVVGDSWSGKTSLVMSALKNSKTVRHQRFNMQVHSKDPKANADALSNIVKQCNESHPFWLILQNFYDKDSERSFERLLSERRTLNASQGQTILLPSNVKLIWQLTSMSQLPISVVLNTKKLFLPSSFVSLEDFFMMRTNFILQNLSSRHQEILREDYLGFLSALQQLFASNFHPFKVAEGTCPKQILHDTLSLAETLMPSVEICSAESNNSISTAHRKLFYYSFAHVLSMCTVEDQRKKIDHFVRQVLFKRQYTFRQMIFEYQFDRHIRTTGPFYVPNVEHPEFPPLGMENVFVHTLETTVLKYLFENIVTGGKSVNLFGASGCGKSLFVRSIFNGEPGQYLVKCNRTTSPHKIAAFIKEQSRLRAEKEVEQTIPFIVVLEDVAMASDSKGMYHLLKEQHESYIYNTGDGDSKKRCLQIVAEQTTYKGQHHCLHRSLFPFKMDTHRPEYFESVFKMILSALRTEASSLVSSGTIEIMQNSKELSQLSIQVIMSINKAKMETWTTSHVPLENIYELLEFADLKRDLIRSFKYLSRPSTVTEPADIVDIFMSGLLGCVRRVVSQDKDEEIVQGIVKRSFDSYLTNNHPVYDPHENYYLSSTADNLLTRVDREYLEEELQSRLKQKFDVSNLLLFNKEFMDYVYGMYMAVTYECNIFVQHYELLPRKLSIHHLLESLGKETVVVPADANSDKIVEIIRQIFKKNPHSEEQTYIVVTAGTADKLRGIFSVLQRLYHGFTHEEELLLNSKKIVVASFRRQIRFAFCTCKDFQLSSVLEFKDLIRTCARIRVKKPSKATVHASINLAVDTALFNQSRNLAKVFPSGNQSFQSNEQRRRNSSLLVKQRKSQFSLVKEGKQVFSTQLKSILERIFQLYESSEGEGYLRRYLRSPERLYKFLTLFIALLQFKHSGLMYKRRVLESSKEIIFNAAEFVRHYNGKCQAAVEQSKKLAVELLQVQTHKNILSQSIERAQQDGQLDNKQLTFQQRITSMQVAIAAKKLAVNSLKDKASSAFNSINRAEISELRSEFLSNFEVVQPVFESICVLLEEPINQPSMKRVFFDAGFKSRLSKSLFVKCSDSDLEAIMQNISKSIHIQKMVAAQSLSDWISLGVQHQIVQLWVMQMERKSRLEIDALRKRIAELTGSGSNSHDSEYEMGTYQKICQKQKELSVRLQKSKRQNAELSRKEHYVSGLQKLFSMQAEWTSLLKRAQSEQHHLFYKSIEASLFLAFGGALKRDQQKLLKENLVGIAGNHISCAGNFDVTDFLKDACRHSKDILLPASAALSQKIISILYCLEYSQSVMVVESSEWELQLFLNNDKFAYLYYSEEAEFQQSLLKCVSEGRYAMVLGCRDELPHSLLSVILQRCGSATDRSKLLWRGANISVNDNFRLVMIVENLKETDNYPEATSIEFHPTDKDVAECLSRHIFKEMLEFDMEKAQRRLAELEVAIEWKIWDILSKIEATADSDPELPVPQTALQECFKAQEQLKDFRKEEKNIEESIQKYRIYDKEVFILAGKLVPYFRVFNNLASDKRQGMTFEEFARLSIQTTRSVLKCESLAAAECRSALRQSGNLEAIVAQLRAEIMKELDTHSSNVMAIALHWLEMLSQQKPSRLDHFAALLTDEQIGEMMFPNCSDRFELAHQILKTCLYREEFQICLGELLKKGYRDEASILRQIGRYKLTFSQSSYLKRLVTPDAFRNELLQAAEKSRPSISKLGTPFNGCSVIREREEAIKELDLSEIISSLRPALGVKASLRISPTAEKLDVASTCCSKQVLNCSNDPVCLYLNEAYSKYLRKFELSRDAIDHCLSAWRGQQPPTLATVELLTQFPLLPCYDRLKELYRKCQYFKGATTNNGLKTTKIDIEESPNPVMHVILLANNQRLVVKREGNILLKKGILLLPCVRVEGNINRKDFEEVSIPMRYRSIEVHVKRDDSALLQLAESFARQ